MENPTLPDLAVGTGTWGIAAVIPKYLSLRLQSIKLCHSLHENIRFHKAATG